MFENVPKPEEIPEKPPEQENISDDNGVGDVAADVIAGIVELAVDIFSDND